MESHVPPTLFRAFIIAGSLIGTSFAGAPIEKQTKEIDAIDGALTLGYQGSKDLHTGYADLLQPLFSSGGNAALFYDGRFSFDDSDQEVQSHGLVFRYRVPDRDIIFGANVYYDSFDSARDHNFDQLGLGVEVLTKWVDFRANYYLPDQKRERIDTRAVVVGNVDRGVRLLGFTAPSIGPEGTFVSPRPVVQDFVSGRFQRHEFTRFESPLEGLDTELGFLIPGLDRYAEVRIFGGYYHYLNPFGADFDGFKARLEARVRKGIIAEVEYWDDTELSGGHWTGGIRVSLPFNLGNIIAGRNPFEGAGESFGPPSGDFGDRMTDLVVRSHRVKTTTSGYVQTRIQNATSVAVRREDGRILVTPSFDDESSGTSGGLTLSGTFSMSANTSVNVVGSLTPEQLAALEEWAKLHGLTFEINYPTAN
jgi:Inverse autotransporter, beta-domain